MSKTLIWGIVTNSEIKTSQQGKNYGSIALSTSFKAKDGQIKTLTNYVSVLDEYNLGLMKQQLVGVGDHLVIDCNISARTYENKDRETVAAINYVANLINNLDIATRYNMIGGSQQQQVANVNPQATYNAPINTTPQNNNTSQPTTPGNTNPWEIDL